MMVATKPILSPKGGDKHVVMTQLTRQRFIIFMRKIPNSAYIIFQFF